MQPTAECLVIHKHPVIHPDRFNQAYYDYVVRTPAELNYSPVVGFTSRELAVSTYSENILRELLCKPEDIERAWDPGWIEFVRDHLPALFDPMPVPQRTDKPHEDLWHLCRTVARVYTDEGHVAANTKPKHNYAIALDRVKAAKAAGYVGYPRQAQQILNALIARDKAISLESDLEQMMNELVANRTIKTKQDPWRLFQFYRPQFIDDSLIQRGG